MNDTRARYLSPTEGGGGMRSPGGPAALSGFPPPESLRPTLVGEHYMVSAGHPLVAQVAAQVLERGGNAIDAGVAGGLAANVVQADMANFGGIAPILVRLAGSDEVWSIAGVGTWGSDVSIDAFRERYGDDMPLGASVAVVPGAPSAWLTALARFGTWSFAEVSAPAIELAGKGFPLDVRVAQALEVLGRGFKEWKSSRAIYWPHSRPPHPGERLCQPDLARLLQEMVRAGTGSDRSQAIENARRAFYEGRIAEEIVRFSQAGGGWLRKADLASYRSEVALAPSVTYRGWQVHTSGFWSQGPVLLQALAILEYFDLTQLRHNTVDYLHYVAEALKLAFSDRERYYGDPNFVEVDELWLLSGEHAEELKGMIRPDAVLPNLPTMARGEGRRYDTTYLCVIDGEGNAFSATPSDTLDGGPIVPGLGIIISPRGVQSRLDPAHPSTLAPGKRPRITPAPALALSVARGRDRMAWPFGCPGGDVIMQAMLQAFLNRVHFDMTPQQAVEAARVATFSFPDSFYPHGEAPGKLSVEARIPESVRVGLQQRGHDVHLWPDYAFDAGGVLMTLDLQLPAAEGRVLGAAADPRRIGYAVGR